MRSLFARLVDMEVLMNTRWISFLSAREKEILQLMGEGLSSPAAAERLVQDLKKDLGRRSAGYEPAPTRRYVRTARAVSVKVCVLFWSSFSRSVVRKPRRSLQKPLKGTVQIPAAPSSQ